MYGRAPGDSVRVAWGDGRETTARTERDGSYVLARRGRVGVDRVTVFDGGTVALEVKDL